VKIRRPGEGPPGDSRRPPAISALIEKKEARYIPLECGHYTTHEANVLYSSWRTKALKGKYFCETCGKWIKLRAKPKPVPITQEPLF